MKRREMASAGVAGQRRERGICPLHLMGVSCMLVASPCGCGQGLCPAWPGGRSRGTHFSLVQGEAMLLTSV